MRKKVWSLKIISNPKSFFVTRAKDLNPIFLKSPWKMLVETLWFLFKTIWWNNLELILTLPPPSLGWFLLKELKWKTIYGLTKYYFLDYLKFSVKTNYKKFYEWSRLFTYTQMHDCHVKIVDIRILLNKNSAIYLHLSMALTL